MRPRRPRPVRVPRGWTPAQASAAIGLLERIADAIWAGYGDAIEAWRDQQRDDGAQTEADDVQGDEDGWASSVVDPIAWGPQGPHR